MKVRNATWDDLEAVNQLLADCDLHDIGERDTSLEDLQKEWSSPGLEVERDVFVVEHRQRLIGYAWFWERSRGKPVAIGYVHPRDRGKGVGLELVRRTEERAREIDASLLLNYVLTNDQVARKLLETRGYESARTYFRMVIDLGGPIEPPVLPDGIALREFDSEHDDERAVHAVVNEAFADEWDFVPDPFDVWRECHLGHEDSDPTLWHFALEGDTIAGCSVCSRFLDGGFVDALAVRRPWRRRGLGLALLVTSLRTFSERGHARVALGVDSENESGATRLYERAGMRVLFSFVRYELKLNLGGGS